MIAGVADTHAAIWFLSGDDRLSAPAKDFFDQGAQARRKIVLSPISLAEVVHLVEKKRLPASAFDDLKGALSNPNHVLEEAPFTAEWWKRCEKSLATTYRTCLIAWCRRRPSSWAFLSSVATDAFDRDTLQTLLSKGGSIRGISDIRVELIFRDITGKFSQWIRQTQWFR
jgi:predicted nucleic acid-binding protein